MSGHVRADLVRLVHVRAGEVCEYCRLPQASQEATFHVDHILPRAKGGSTSADNLALACVSCSLHKAARSTAADPMNSLDVLLFHPRQDDWNEHFALAPDFHIDGRTPTGRATIAALHINRPAIIAIRQELNLLGRFPTD